jgi:hypothetical protein
MRTNCITKFHIAALALLSSLILQPSALLAQGSLTPPGAPGPTMKTLAQIEPRTPISTAPFTISVPGSYYLTANLTVSTGDAIAIATSGVTLDLAGFTLASTAPIATGYGIVLNGGLRNLTIVNGFIRGGVTDNAGIYSGPGFQYGIYYSGVAPVGTRVVGVSVSGCLSHGIYLNTGDSTVVESCTVRTVGSYGIVASTIKGSVAVDCGGYAVVGDQVSDSRGESTSSGSGVSASTVLNCCGYSSSGNGLYASTAQNCFGQSSSSTGLYASTAQTCYGHSGSGYGLNAITAQNCYSYSGSGTGLYAQTAQNCYGSCGGGGTGLYAYYVAIGCRGYSYSGTGLSADIANSCSGSSVSVAHKYNMP